ncbi:hypothetical protein MTP99_009144 [Tenebrio molitor]|nr:hypothetical protein MTP99_009144 [Tenebrio molitor]
MVIQMRSSCNHWDALFQRKIRSSHFVLRSPRFGSNKKKTYRERKSGDSVGDRRAGGCATSREMRITCVAIGIRNHPRERIADAMVLIVRRCQASGPSKSPKIFTVPITVTVLPIWRDPSPSREIEG